jgi:hypothetical protein
MMTEVLAHEIGHNAGAHHNQEDASFQGLFNYSYGWREAYWSDRTIMSYGSPLATRLMSFSTPLSQYNGFTIGNSQNADNRRTMQESLPSMVQWRARSTTNPNHVVENLQIDVDQNVVEIRFDESSLPEAYFVYRKENPGSDTNFCDNQFIREVIVEDDLEDIGYFFDFIAHEDIGPTFGYAIQAVSNGHLGQCQFIGNARPHPTFQNMYSVDDANQYFITMYAENSYQFFDKVKVLYRQGAAEDCNNIDFSLTPITALRPNDRIRIPAASSTIGNRVYVYAYFYNDNGVAGSRCVGPRVAINRYTPVENFQVARNHLTHNVRINWDNTSWYVQGFEIYATTNPNLNRCASGPSRVIDIPNSSINQFVDTHAPSYREVYYSMRGYRLDSYGTKVYGECSRIKVAEPTQSLFNRI